MTGRGQSGLDLTDGEGSEVEDSGRQHRVGPGVDGRREVLHRASSPARDDRDADLAAYGADELEVEAVGRAVGVHGVEQDLAGPELGGAHGPLDGVQSGALAP